MFNLEPERQDFKSPSRFHVSVIVHLPSKRIFHESGGAEGEGGQG